MEGSGTDIEARGALARSGAEAPASQVGAREWTATSVDYEPSSFNPTPSRRYYFYLMAPAVVVLACITIYPFIWLIYMSLH
ncbi:MAG: hypothetical protein MI920_16760, partial [Kiloniellales bacterium]|nr:hypothetical protein [Kiloniellales bacterium]